MNKTRVEKFHNQLSTQYSDLTVKCVPRYLELIENMFKYIPADLQPKRILDLGCGSGNLTEQILKFFPEAEIDALDISEEVLNESRKRFMHTPNVRYIHADFTTLHLAPGSYDLVMSSISMHHIENPDKPKLYKEVYQALSSGGLFVFADQTGGITDEIHNNNIATWKEQASELGSSEEDWDMWRSHRDAYGLHQPVKWHFGELELAGFKKTDLVWKYLLWAVIWARK